MQAMCINCIYSATYRLDDFLICRRYPPGLDNSSFIYDNWWCGEFKSKKVPTEIRNARYEFSTGEPL